MSLFVAYSFLLCLTFVVVGRLLVLLFFFWCVCTFRLFPFDVLFVIVFIGRCWRRCSSLFCGLVFKLVLLVLVGLRVALV